MKSLTTEKRSEQHADLPENPEGAQKDSPVWKEDNFLRLRGLMDALVHKTDFKTEDGKNVLAGAYYERVRR